jgi:hypothetical protein
MGFIAPGDNKTADERYSPYKHKFFKWASKRETQLFDSYLEEYLDNPLCTFCVDYLATRFTEFELVGDANAVEAGYATMDEIGFWSNWAQNALQMVLNGMGIMLNDDAKGKLRRTATKQWQVSRDEKTGITTYVLQGSDPEIKVEWPPDEPINDIISLFQVLELPDRPEGISFMRSSLHGLAALRTIIYEDLPAGVKNFLTVERLWKLPLDGYQDKASQQTFMEELRSNWKNRDPSSTGITIIDKETDLFYMGSGPTGTPMSGRVINVAEFIAPILAPILLNFCVPLGLVLQTGANKSLIQRQQMECNLRLHILRKRLEKLMYTQLWPVLGLDPVKVKINWPKTDSEILDEWKLHREMFERRIISREFILERYGIVDNGTEFYEGIPTPDSEADTSATDKGNENNDDGN